MLRSGLDIQKQGDMRVNNQGMPCCFPVLWGAEKGGLPLSKSLRNTSSPFEEVLAGSSGSDALAAACGEPAGSAAPASTGSAAPASAGCEAPASIPKSSFLDSCVSF